MLRHERAHIRELSYQCLFNAQGGVPVYPYHGSGTGCARLHDYVVRTQASRPLQRIIAGLPDAVCFPFLWSRRCQLHAASHLAPQSMVMSPTRLSAYNIARIPLANSRSNAFSKMAYSVGDIYFYVFFGVADR